MSVIQVVRRFLYSFTEINWLKCTPIYDNRLYEVESVTMLLKPTFIKPNNSNGKEKIMMFSVLVTVEHFHFKKVANSIASE